jgi:aldehyde:ferredoxin oxidoreductase
LDLYYQLMGWTPDGIPTRAKLIDLDVEWAVDYLPV